MNIIKFNISKVQNGFGIVPEGHNNTLCFYTNRYNRTHYMYLNVYTMEMFRPIYNNNVLEL